MRPPKAPARAHLYQDRPMMRDTRSPRPPLPITRISSMWDARATVPPPPPPPPSARMLAQPRRVTEAS